jgi:hypothetical protein
MMDMAADGGGVAAGEPAVPVPAGDDAADVHRDRLGRRAGVQWQADGSGWAGELAAEPGGEPARAREQPQRVADGESGRRAVGPRQRFVAERRHGVGWTGLVRVAATRVGGGESICIQVASGEVGEDVTVDGAGDDGHELGVTVCAARRGGAVCAELGRQRGIGLGLAKQLRQRHVQLDLNRLAVPFGQAASRQQQSARFLEGVVVALRLRPQILRTAALVQAVHHSANRSRGGRSEVTVEPGVTAEVLIQEQMPLAEPALVGVSVRPGSASPDLLNQSSEVSKVSSADDGLNQDVFRCCPHVRGELSEPVTDRRAYETEMLPAASAAATDG